jgi:hypothetical protein
MTTCKNCGKEIYQERDGTWYHTEDDYEMPHQKILLDLLLCLR